MYHLVDFCRLCLTFEGEFSDMCIDNTIEKVTACIRDLEFEDHLPTLICTKCSEQLDKYFEFRNRCLVSEFLLNNYVEKFLVDSKTSKFTNTKLQVNILKNCATTNKSLGNVKLRRNSNSNEYSQKKCKIVLENIRNFVDTSLGSNKNTCKVQHFQEFCDKSNPVSCELQDFEDFFNTNRSDYVHSEVSNVSDCEAFINSSIFSDDDDVFLEEEDENDAQPKSPTAIIAAKHDYDQSTSAKRKISASEGFNKKYKIDQNLDPGILTDITERVKLRKRKVQIRAQTINYSELSSENVHKTKKREAPKSPKPYKPMQANTLKNTKYTLTNDNLQHLHNKQKAATSESTIPAVNKLTNNSSINQLICGTVSDNLGPKLDQISKNWITTATNFETEIERANINWSTASYIEGCDWSQKQNEINTDKEVINLINETNQSTALNMGIVRIDQNQEDLSSSSKKIATVTDYEENIATHCIMPVQIQDNNKNPDTTIQSNESTQQLYQANFGNLLKYHITNVKKGNENKKITYKVLMSSNRKPVKIILPVKNVINAPKQLHATNTRQNIEPLNSRFVLNCSEDKILLPTSSAKSNNLQVSLLKKRLTSSNTSVDKSIQKPKLDKESENTTDLNIPLVPLETINKNQRLLLPRPTIKVVDMSILIDNTKPLPPFFEHKTEQNSICQQTQPDCIDTLKDDKSIPKSKDLSNDLETIPTFTSYVNEASDTLMKVENQINLRTESHASTINIDTCEDNGITDIASNNELCQSQVEQIMPTNIEDSHHAKKPFTSIKRNAESAYKYMQAKRIKKKRQYNKDKFVIDDPLNILTLLKKKRRKPEGAKNLKKSCNSWPRFVNKKRDVNKPTLCVDKQNTGANLNIDTSQEDLNPTTNQNENELNTSDSENSEIDVVTVFSEKRNSGARMDQKAFSERIRRNEGRSLIMHLCGLIPEFTSKSVIPVQAILNSAKKYIKTLQCESRRLEEERIRLLREKTKFTAILQGLKDHVDINVCD